VRHINELKDTPIKIDSQLVVLISINALIKPAIHTEDTELYNLLIYNCFTDGSLNLFYK
jgi:hypothetical protein